MRSSRGGPVSSLRTETGLKLSALRVSRKFVSESLFFASPADPSSPKTHSTSSLSDELEDSSTLFFLSFGSLGLLSLEPFSFAAFLTFSPPEEGECLRFFFFSSFSCCGHLFLSCQPLPSGLPLHASSPSLHGGVPETGS